MRLGKKTKQEETPIVNGQSEISTTTETELLSDDSDIKKYGDAEYNIGGVDNYGPPDLETYFE